MVESKWICLIVRERYKRNIEFPNALNAIKEILSSDCIHILFLGSKLYKNVYDNELDGYVFVKCKNIDKHLSELKQSRFIENVLNSYDNIQFVANEEIRDMIRDWKGVVKKKKIDSKILYGDVVYVKNGKYSDLNGIIVSNNDSSYTVSFKFNFGFVNDIVFFNNIEKKTNIFEVIKCPV